MVAEVNKIVYNTLVTERAITLPDVGTLSLVRHAATMVSKDVVAAPRLTVEFSSHATATSIVDIIEQVGGVENAVAEDVYSRWLEKVQSGSTLTIEGVGVLRNKSFEVDKELFAVLNPSQSSVKVKRRNSGAVAAALVTTFVGAAIVCGCAAWFFCGGDACVVEQEVVADIEEGVTPAPAVEIEEECVVVVEVESVPEAVAEEVVEPVVDDWTKQNDIRHWVVVGSYSTIENAEAAVRSTEKANADIKCKIFPLGKMFAVAIYGSCDLEECVEYKQKYSREFKQAWIFTPKEYR
jgi:hypothetical protein